MTREEAIERIKRIKEPREVYNAEAFDMAIKALKQEPTIRNCFGCKYSKDNHNAGTEECHLCMWENQYTPTTKNDLAVVPCEDAISRQAAIDAVKHAWAKGLEPTQFLEELPPVSPARPKGKRIEFTKVIVPEPYNKWEQAWKCSECGFDDGWPDWNFYPNCGADMKGEQDG